MLVQLVTAPVTVDGRMPCVILHVCHTIKIQPLCWAEKLLQLLLQVLAVDTAFTGSDMSYIFGSSTWLFMFNKWMY